MKKRIILFLVVSTVLMFCYSLPVFATSSFNDIKGHWAESAINSAVEKNLFSGTSETAFSPDLNMSRGMFVTVLGRFASGMGIEIIGNKQFSDVNSNEYYAPYVGWAAVKGIVTGKTESLFLPDDDVTREQMCVMIVRFLKAINYNVPVGDEMTFSDCANIDDYAVEAVKSAVKMGLIQGINTDNGTEFKPFDSASRAQTAVILLRVDNLNGIYNSNPAAVVDNQTGNSEGTTDGNNSEIAGDQSGKTCDTADNPSGKTDNATGKTDDTADNPSGRTDNSSEKNDDSTVNPPGVIISDKEKAEEAEIAGLLSNILKKSESISMNGVDSEVRNCLEVVQNCASGALNDRNNGGFLSRDYVKSKYGQELSKVKRMFGSMNAVQKLQLVNLVVRLESIDNFLKIMDYFGVSISL